MKILGLEKVSMVDYPKKICATIFTGGCDFRCVFCHNSGIVHEDYTPYTEEEIFEYLESRKKLLDAVTISGGEPTIQSDLESFIVKVREMGFLVKLDTNGTNPIILKNLLDKNLLDYVAMDIKNNFSDYGEIAGTPNFDANKIKESLQILRDSNVEYELRTTLVAHYHSEENIKKMANELAGENILYLQKFKDCDTCIKSNLEAVPKSEAEEFQKILSKKIKNVILRGY